MPILPLVNSNVWYVCLREKNRKMEQKLVPITPIARNMVCDVKNESVYVFEVYPIANLS